MEITVSGRHLDLSEALRTRVAGQLDVIAHKYFDHALEAQVTFGRARAFFTCDINVHAGRGLTLRGEGEAADANSAFDDAAEHIAKRLRRYRRRVNGHARELAQGRAPEGVGSRARPEMAREYILLENDDLPADLTTSGIADAYATVVAEMPTSIDRLTVGEAVMRMDLADNTVLMFRNAVSGELNVVYRRLDGHLGWIDPTATRN